MPQPYAKQIHQTRRQIKRHPGDDSNLRDRLLKLRVRRYEKKQNVPTPMPWSGQYESTVGGLNRDHDFDQAGIAAEEDTVRRRYGFDDPSDPFSRARQLQEQFSNAQRGTGNNYAAAGQLYAGSLSNARNIDRTNFETVWNTEKSNYDDLLRSLAARRLESSRTKDEGILDAEAERLEDALQERVDPAEAPRKPKFVRKFYKQQKRKR